MPHNAYQVLVDVDDGSGASNSSVTQLITVNVTSNAMTAGANTNDTFVFHTNLGQPYSNSVNNFDVTHDFLQFDKGMFAGGNTAAAVLAAATNDNHGNTVIADSGGDHIIVMGVTTAVLAQHLNDILFV